MVTSKFEMHPPTLCSALLTSAWVGLVSMLAALFIPPAFGYARTHGLRSCNKDEKRKGSGSASAPVSDEQPISSTTSTGPFEAYGKQAGKTGMDGSCHEANATVDAASEALAAAEKEE